MSTKAKQFRKYLVEKIVVLEGNLSQSAELDLYLARETLHRAAQFEHLKAGDTTAAHKEHDERIECLEKALALLRVCPACETHPSETKEET